MSSDKGAIFTSPIQLSNGLSAASPQLITSGKFVYIVWYDYDTNSNTDIFFTQITIDAGNVPIVNEPVNLSNSAAGSYFPQIYLNGKDIFVVWQEQIGFNYDVFFVKDKDKGSNLYFLSDNNFHNLSLVILYFCECTKDIFISFTYSRI